MKYSIIFMQFFFLISFTFPVYGQTKNTFPFVKYDKVIMYDYQSSGEDPCLVDKEGELIPTVKIRKQVQLDTNTIKLLNKKIIDKRSYGQQKAICFDPHLAFAYYSNDKVVRNVLICMGCNALRADIDINAQHQNKQGEGEKVYYSGDGLSKSFREYLNQLLVKYNFSHQKGKSIFDE